MVDATASPPPTRVGGHTHGIQKSAVPTLPLAFPRPMQAANGCLAQCFHYRPDVYFAHLHTTGGAAAIRIGPVDSGLGPTYNKTEAADMHAAFGRYNVCVCEPASWSGAGAGRGSCPQAKPADKEYAEQAAFTLCRNIAGASGVDPRLCSTCDPSRGRDQVAPHDSTSIHAAEPSGQRARLAEGAAEVGAARGNTVALSSSADEVAATAASGEGIEPARVPGRTNGHWQLP